MITQAFRTNGAAYIAKKVLATYPLWAVGLLFFLPIVVASIWAALPAFGYFPVLKFTTLSLEPWRMLLELPWLAKSIWLTLFTGVVATALSLGIAVIISATFYTSGIYKVVHNTLAPLMAIPHLSIAAGLAFLLAPSGFIFRVLATFFGWDTPPNLIIVPDRYGLVFILVLLLKEIPFFLFIIHGALSQIKTPNYIAIARSMGYDAYTAWLKIILPQIYSRIKLPIIIVLIFSMSVVDIAILLAPSTPAPYTTMLLELFYDSDFSMRLTAAAGGLLLMLIIGAVILLWRLLEMAIMPIWESGIIANGKRGHYVHITRYLAYALLFSTAAFAFASLFLMLIWSVSEIWRFPAYLPEKIGLSNWSGCVLCASLSNSFFVALWVTLLSVAVVISLLEINRSGFFPAGWFYIPLLVPQIIFLFGFDLMLIYMDLKGFWGVVWAHWMYVLPYVFLILYIPYLQFDKRYEQTAYGLRASRFKMLMRVKLPLLFRPIIYSFAVGFAVSINEYLPTLIAGGGRIDTLTTEMVTLSSGGDRRIIGVTSVSQAALPCLIFIIALLLPSLQARNRRGLAL